MRYKISYKNKIYLIKAVDFNSAISKFNELEDGTSPMTYKKLKEKGYTSEDWKDWSDEEKVEKSKSEKSSKRELKPEQKTKVLKSTQQWRSLIEKELAMREEIGYEVTKKSTIDNIKVNTDRYIEQTKDARVKRILTEYKSVIGREPEYSSQMVSISKEVGLPLIGYDYRYKTLESLYGKLNRPGEDLDTFELSDAVRYTFNVDNGSQVTKTLDKLTAGGYKVLKFKNTWKQPHSAYRGINVKLLSPSNDIIEVQFHTVDDLSTKEYNHERYYEPQRKSQFGSKEWQKYEQLQIQATDKLKTPEGFDKLDYPLYKK